MLDDAGTIIIIFTILAVCSLTFAIGATVYGRNKKYSRLGDEDQDGWLFSHFFESVCKTVYGKSRSDKLSGISRKEYDRYCRIIHRDNDYEASVGKRVTGLASLMLCLCVPLLGEGSFSAGAAFLFIGVIAFYLLYIMPYANIKSAVEKRLFHIVDDMPRFLSLMEKAMDLPIDQAMAITAKRFDSPLSDDIIDSLNKVSLGASGWTQTLTDLARLYQLQDFSDLILEITNSYEQGLNIRPVIERKAYEVEQKRMLAVEEHDTKIKTMIFLPIIMMKVVPLMVLIALPMLSKL